MIRLSYLEEGMPLYLQQKVAVTSMASYQYNDVTIKSMWIQV